MTAPARIDQPATTSLEDLLEAVRSIAPTLERHRDYGEREGRMHDEAVDALRSSGLLSLYLPRSLGGGEVDTLTYMRASQAVSEIDSAAGWLMMVTNGPGFIFRGMPDEGVEEIWSSGPGTIVAETFARPVAIRAAEGGYVVDGRATFASGCRHADWCGVLAILHDDAGPVIANGMPRQFQAVVPMRELQIADNWDVSGMRGTGSDDIIFDEVFVPRRFTFELGTKLTLGKHYGGTLYRLPGIALSSLMKPVMLACLRVALDDLTDVALNKVPFASSTTLRTRSIAQIHYGRALAQYRACVAYAERVHRDTWRRAEAGEEATAEQRADLALCATFVTEKAAEAIRELTTAAGTSSIYKRNRIERASRDMDVLRHHGWSNESRYGSVAQIYWGLDTDFPLINF